MEIIIIIILLCIIVFIIYDNNNLINKYENNIEANREYIKQLEEYIQIQNKMIKNYEEGKTIENAQNFSWFAHQLSLNDEMLIEFEKSNNPTIKLIVETVKEIKKKMKEYEEEK